MRAVVERVLSAGVRVGGEEASSIKKGLLVLLGIAPDDGEDDVKYIVDKTVNLRIFEDGGGKMNLSLRDICGEIMLVSQFTLMGDARKGRRPSFTGAGRPEEAEPIYRAVTEEYKKAGIEVKTGVFQADMKVEHVNDGPVTILLDSKKTF